MKGEKIIKFLFIGIIISWILYFIFYIQSILLILKQKNKIDTLEIQLIQEQIQRNPTNSRTDTKQSLYNIRRSYYE